MEELLLSLKDYKIGILVTIIIGLIAIVGAESYTIAKMRENQPYLDSDKKAIEAAITNFRNTTGASRADLMKHRFPVVIRFGGVRCVALQIPKGSLGRTPVYCFDLNYKLVHNIDTNAQEVVDIR
jgi:hypothetical protein